MLQFPERKLLTYVVLVGCSILFFFSTMRHTADRMPWYEQMLCNAVYPFQLVISRVSVKLRHVWDSYIALTDVAKINQELERQLARQRLVVVELTERLTSLKELKDLVKMAGNYGCEYIAARVVANDPRSEFRTLILDKGYAAGIGKNQAVLSSGGLIGKIGKVGKFTSHVLLISDPNNYVDVLIQRSRARALLVGHTRKTILRRPFYLSKLEYLRRVSDVMEGDLVVTSGLDSLYPKGLPIGTVHEIDFDKYGIFKRAIVIPLADLTNIENVLVIKRCVND